jgi:hypothetical protein
MPSDRILSCALVRTGAGLEVRTGYEGDILHVRRVFDADEGRAIARELRRAVLEKRMFNDLGIDDSPR